MTKIKRTESIGGTNLVTYFHVRDCQAPLNASMNKIMK